MAAAAAIRPAASSLASFPILRRSRGRESSSFTPQSRDEGRSLPSPFLSSTPKRSLSKAQRRGGFLVACLPSTPRSATPSSTRLFVSGLSFRTTEESLRNAFQNFGQLAEVNLVMDRIANRPRGFAFLCYATEEESKRAIEGMHGKFLDGRVIFVEVAKPRSELRRGNRQAPNHY